MKHELYPEAKKRTIKRLGSKRIFNAPDGRLAQNLVEVPLATVRLATVYALYTRHCESVDYPICRIQTVSRIFSTLQPTHWPSANKKFQRPFCQRYSPGLVWVILPHSDPSKGRRNPARERTAPDIEKAG